ncbi:MAG: hypothetical protein ABIP06_11775 [Pyrinomonadaceae bacterium]
MQSTGIEKDISAINRIGAIQTILQTLSRATGMRASVVSSLADDKWTAAAAIDETGLGLKTGDQLDMATTY